MKVTKAQRTAAEKLLAAGWTWQEGFGGYASVSEDMDGHLFLEAVPEGGPLGDYQVAVDRRGLCLGLGCGMEEFTAEEAIYTARRWITRDKKEEILLSSFNFTKRGSLRCIAVVDGGDGRCARARYGELVFCRAHRGLNPLNPTSGWTTEGIRAAVADHGTITLDFQAVVDLSQAVVQYLEVLSDDLPDGDAGRRAVERFRALSKQLAEVAEKLTPVCSWCFSRPVTVPHLSRCAKCARTICPRCGERPINVPSLNSCQTCAES